MEYKRDDEFVFNPEDQYGDAVYFGREDWPLSEEGLKEIVERTVLRITGTIPPELCDKIVYFAQKPPDVEFYSDKDPLAGESFNRGFLAWKYPGAK